MLHNGIIKLVNNLKTIGIVAAFLILGITVFLGVILFSSGSTTNKTNAITTVNSCKHTGINHVVIIQNSQAMPAQTSAALCDKLTITNNDSADYLIAFGPHENHIPYDGIAEKLLSKGQSLTVTLNQAGAFHFHDHLADVVQGNFTVK